jgi:hypothetical protein
MTLIYIATIIMLLWLVIKKLPTQIEIDRELKRLAAREAELEKEHAEWGETYDTGRKRLIAQLDKYGLKMDESWGTSYIVPKDSYGISDLPIDEETKSRLETLSDGTKIWHLEVRFK